MGFLAQVTKGHTNRPRSRRIDDAGGAEITTFVFSLWKPPVSFLRVPSRFHVERLAAAEVERGKHPPQQSSIRMTIPSPLEARGRGQTGRSNANRCSLSSSFVHYRFLPAQNPKFSNRGLYRPSREPSHAYDLLPCPSDGYLLSCCFPLLLLLKAVL